MPLDEPEPPHKFLWRKLGYPTAQAAIEAGINPTYRTYEWLHLVAEKAEGKKLPWPWDD